MMMWPFISSVEGCKVRHVSAFPFAGHECILINNVRITVEPLPQLQTFIL